MELLIVTGMSGAGKSQAANILEDIGFYCMDNIPPSIIPSVLDLASCSKDFLNKIAIITDVRGGDLFAEINNVLSDLRNNGINFKVLFLDANDNVLITRYRENRRLHPLVKTGISIMDAVKAERKMLTALRNDSDYIIDTSFTTIGQLKGQLSEIFVGSFSEILKIKCVSFGFKYGLDNEADLVFDVRCLPNPFYVEELREKTGIEKCVQEYVMSSDESVEFLKRILSFIEFALPLYIKEGKNQLTVAVGCTGGKHRSVTFAELISKRLQELKYDCVTLHRDIQKR